MDLRNRISSHYQNGQEIYLRNISIDCVIFGFHENELKVLLLHTLYSNLWALPGGFILKEEHMDDAADRILLDRTGLDNIYLQQFHVFSKPERSTKEINQKFLKNLGLELEESWMFERFVTVGYNALVDFNKVKKLESDIFSSKCEWFNIDSLPDMHLDHQEIINTALEKMQLDLNYHPIGYNLLPEKFTMPELQKLYETVLNKKLDRRNFQRKIIGAKILKRLEETKKGVAHKAPHYYKFDLKNYQTALKVGLGFDL
ncbi:MAG: NUDIX domain-containing protein [Bacteroidetes bacterium]|nr:NUDIX domain-containing protein [Bacteroidota bacterium]MBU1373477.1 NUDIX domain-containing protein [Bacteroidota bacterium]MBU1485235.1 NUDIX domain-containing protein [Bacteroidota bacterium]MBU1760761.1 NUDIX domain-containing protein [Bacteroidota bacterium]MBU2266989.1 NUDIX domain-containing protein [Bacteroidota bacterium]